MTWLKTAIVTGATGAIGEAIARGLAAQADYTVYLACRDVARGEKVAARIREATGSSEVFVEEVDLASLASIRAFRERFDRPFDTLVNDAAVAPRRREVTEEGVERQLAVNVLGYVRMVDAFADLLKAPQPRIVNVASYWAGGLDVDDLEFERRPYDNDAAYRQSKQANRMLTVVQAEALASRRISVNACHPGDVRSTLSQSLGFGGSQTAEEGARTPLFLALSPEGYAESGKYFAHRREEPCRFSADRHAVAALHDAIRAYG
jgi:NAD(P)-dependent dehydrogenase (short-subunit alcohol dehydrogenase family)